MVNPVDAVPVDMAVKDPVPAVQASTLDTGDPHRDYKTLVEKFRPKEPILERGRRNLIAFFEAAQRLSWSMQFFVGFPLLMCRLLFEATRQ